MRNQEWGIVFLFKGNRGIQKRAGRRRGPTELLCLMFKYTKVVRWTSSRPCYVGQFHSEGSLPQGATSPSVTPQLDGFAARRIVLYEGFGRDGCHLMPWCSTVGIFLPTSNLRGVADKKFFLFRIANLYVCISTKNVLSSLVHFFVFLQLGDKKKRGCCVATSL